MQEFVYGRARRWILKAFVETSVVTVEEPPIEHIRKCETTYESGSQYNIKASTKDEFLSGCFAVPHNDVRNTMLSHNHIMLVLRAFMTAAHWDLPDIKEKT